MDTGKKDGLEGGLSGGAETGPEVGVVAGELLAEEDRRHSTCVHVMGGLKEVGELEGKRVRISLLAEIEEGLGLGAEVVGGGHKVGDNDLKWGRVGAENGRELNLLELSRLGIHCERVRVWWR